MYCVGCLVCWPDAVALVEYFARFPSLSLSRFFFFINFLLIFPIVRRLPPDETRTTVFKGKEEKRGVAVEATIRRLFSTRDSITCIYASVSVYMLWADFEFLLPINCGLSWFSWEANHSIKRSKIMHYSVDLDLEDLNPYGKKVDISRNVKNFFSDFKSCFNNLSTLIISSILI